MEERPDFKDKFPGCWDQYIRGCVGVTIVNFGGTDGPFPPINHCYESFEEAKNYQKKHSCSDGGDAKIFSIHFYWPKSKKPFYKNDDGSVVIGNWFFGGMPKKDDDSIRFDFGFCVDDDTILHANHCHNPKGKNFPEYPIQKPMVVYTSNMKQWKQSYSDFNQEVWCVACRKEFAQPKKPKLYLRHSGELNAPTTD